MKNMNSLIARKLTWLLPPAVLLWAVVRAFSYFDSPTNRTYDDVYRMISKKYNIKD